MGSPFRIIYCFFKRITGIEEKCFYEFAFLDVIKKNLKSSKNGNAIFHRTDWLDFVPVGLLSQIQVRCM